MANTSFAATTVESLLSDHPILLKEDEQQQEEEANDNISYWEFINASDADDSDTESLLSLENGFVSWISKISNSDTMEETHFQYTLQNPDLVDLDYPNDDDYNENDDYIDHIDDDDDDDCVYGYGLDDELVPWNLSGKLGRQRMRKLGKRVFSRMSSSKRNPYLYVKPGCVRGKHGLGIKA